MLHASLWEMVESWTLCNPTCCEATRTEPMSSLSESGKHCPPSFSMKNIAASPLYCSASPVKPLQCSPSAKRSFPNVSLHIVIFGSSFDRKRFIRKHLHLAATSSASGAQSEVVSMRVLEAGSLRGVIEADTEDIWMANRARVVMARKVVFIVD